jgi:hypothetical protein
MSAYETIIDNLAELGRVHHRGERQASAQCPAHEDRNPSLSVRYTDGKVLIKCFSGCDYRDVLTALDLHPSALFDGPSKSDQKSSLTDTRYQARKTMTPVQRVLDDLVHMPDFVTRMCQAIGRNRPELYLMDKRDLGNAPNSALLTDPGFRHVAHLLGGAA